MAKYRLLRRLENVYSAVVVQGAVNVHYKGMCILSVYIYIYIFVLDYVYNIYICIQWMILIPSELLY